MDHLFQPRPAERKPIGIRSGTAMTVLGPVPVPQHVPMVVRHH